MPYTHDPSESYSFLEQPKANEVLWRYMDIHRYLDFIRRGSLHFARLDQMSDRWEGAYGDLTLSKWGSSTGMPDEVLQRMREITRTHTFINCWNISDTENYALWELYGAYGKGVALRTTFGSLRESICCEDRVYGSKIKYIDHSESIIYTHNTLVPATYKRKSYSHENEFRLMLFPDSAIHPEFDSMDFSRYSEFIKIPLDFEDFDVEVRLAPGTPGWYLENIVEVTSHYCPSWAVVPSELDKEPFV